MADNWVKARTSIEAVVKLHHPESSGKWSPIVPRHDKNGWGLIEQRWAVDGRQMLKQMNDLIVPLRISISRDVVLAAGNQELDLYQQLLASKADEALARRELVAARMVCLQARLRYTELARLVVQ